MELQQRHRRTREQGFTLIELLIAIVVVGILSAVAIVGIAGLTNTGGQSACKASADAAHASSAAYYANNTNKWESNLTALTRCGAQGLRDPGGRGGRRHGRSVGP